MSKKRQLPLLSQPPPKTESSRRGDASGPVDGAERSVVRVEGMDCASCAVTIERRVRNLPGVKRASVNFATARLDVEHGPEIAVNEIERAVMDAGYTVGRTSTTEVTQFWRTPRMVSALAAVVLLIMGAALQLAGVSGVTQSAAYIAAIMAGGAPIFRAAVSSLRARHMDMNVLMSVAVAGAAGIGAWGEAALTMVLFAVGNVLQIFAVDRTRGAVRALARLAPDEVLVQRDGSEITISADEVGIGDVVMARPGERFAVDGEVVEGASAVDESPITGESTPVEKGPGDKVFSGSLNGSGGLLVRATKPASESTLQKIARMVEDAQATRAPTEQFVDRFSRVYTPAVVTVAIALAVTPPLFGGDFGTWFYRSLALLIIACPCALVISTPVTVVSGIGAASRRGVLIKGGAALETAGRLKALLFDKTGTLTEGRPIVERVMPLGGRGKREVLLLAAALERRSEHPLAHAILSAASGETLPPARDFRTVGGRGAEGEIGGKKYLIGSPRFFEERKIPLENASKALREIEEAGETPVILGSEGGPLAVLGLADAVRPDAKRTLMELRRAGIGEIIMITGDAEAPARRISAALDIDYQAGLLPEQKVEVVRETVERLGYAGMVGDGINDAPALAASSVGFAMGAAGTGVALETADVALMRDDLGKLVGAVRLSRLADRIIKQNIFVSILIKGVFVVLAPFGLVTLWLAILADMGTSIAVTLNGLRLFKARKG